jgi:hypothetical protein
MDSTPRRRYGRRLVLACLAACVGLLALDSLLFRTGFYATILEPDSSTGLFEMILRRELSAQQRYGDRMVATFGNSRFAWSPKVLDQRPGPHKYELRNAGVAGSDVRAWYYMIRDLDPTARRYRALVFGVDDYDDEDHYYNPNDDIRALHYVIARLRLSDIFEFARSFDSRELQIAAFRGGLLKGIVFQSDLQAFLANPRKRLWYVGLCDRNWPMWVYDYQETTNSMVGLQIDWATLKVTFPPGVNDDQRGTVNAFLAHEPEPQIGRLAKFQRTWYGRIIDRYRGSPTKIIFVRLARGPIPRPDNLTHKLSSSIRELASRPNVILLDEHAFESLEHPELFRDGMHLNREGMQRFSYMLEDEITRVLDGPGPGVGEVN